MAPPPRRTVQLEAKILGARGLVSLKGAEEPVTSSASLTLLGAEPVTSEEVAESSEPTYECSKIALVKADDATCASILATPLAVSILEGGESLGSATLSLEPLMQSAGIGETWLPLVGAEGAAAGEVCVTVIAALPLMSEEDWEESSIMTLTIESLHKLPEKWGLSEQASEADHPYTYAAVCSFQGEDMTLTGKMEPPKPPAEEGEAAAEAPAAEEGVEGEASAPAPAPAPSPAPDPVAEAEAAAYSIVFEGGSVTKFLGPEATRALRTSLQAGEPMLKLTIDREVKSPEALFDSNKCKYSALCDPVPAGLLAVEALSATERCAIKAAPMPEELPTPPEVGKGKGPEITPVEEEEDPPGPHPYDEAGTYLKVSVSLTRPLEPKPLPPPPVLPAVSEIIPKRVLPQFAPKTAVEEFDTQVKSIVESMVGEWSSLFPELDLNAPPADDAAKDDRRRALLYALNTSGKYWMFKERLKRSVVRLCKDTMSRPSAEPLDSKSMELFYNELYVKLTQRLHQALNSTFFPPAIAPDAPSVPDQPPIDPPSAASVLGSLASEMEMINQLGAAAGYHKERVAAAKYASAGWYEYAAFLMRVNDSPLAEECSREAIALTPNSSECLVAHGAILASRGNLEQAEVFLKAALDITPDSVSSWLLMALLYDLMGRAHDKKTAEKKAKLLAGADTLDGLYLPVAKMLLPLNATVLIAKALEVEKVEDLPWHLTKGEMLLRMPGKIPEALEEIKTAIPDNGGGLQTNAAGLTLKGQAYYLLGDMANAKFCFGKAKDYSKPLEYPMPALLLLGELCLADGDNEMAKEVYLLACRQAPTCTSWLGVGIACLRMGQGPGAEEALSEANVLNNRHPVVWGTLALFCLGAGRIEEADQALREAYKLDLADADLLVSLGGALLECGKWSDAEGAVRKALLVSPSASGLQGLGETLMEQHRYEEALSAFKEAIGFPDASGDTVKHCKKQASHLLHFHLNRPAEADAL